MKKIFVISTLLAFGLAVAGCATGGSAPAAPTDTDLVRALGGKATVNGDTVTLTGDVTLTADVWVEKNLTVPAGITLDLTADGVRLFLKDGTKLTVNGTVNARGHGDQGKGWVDGSISIEPGTSTTNGSGTINLSGKGRLISIWSGDRRIRKLILDGVTLVGVKDNNMELVWVGEGSELTMKSGTITGNVANANERGGGVAVYESTFTMSGGAITGNSVINNGGWARGGGVSLENSMFTMSGGAITDNTATSERGAFGGGVYIENASTFTMSGGTISGNTVSQAGGGVYFEGDVKAAISGGEISGNSANQGSAGLMLSGRNANLTITGGTISGNSGSGVHVGGGTLIMEGGTIYSSADRFPAGTDASLANAGGALTLANGGPQWSYWGKGGTYTMGGVSKTGGSDIPLKGGKTNDTLIAIPAR
jgi:hypothetical protein